MVRGLCLFLGVMAIQAVNAQNAFDEKWLQMPDKYGEQMLSVFRITEVPVFNVVDRSGVIVMENGFGKSALTDVHVLMDFEGRQNPEDISVTMVYTRYPLENGTYRELYSLLANRLKALFAIAPWLNHPDVDWHVVRQTNCTTLAEASSLFHGFIVEFHNFSPPPLTVSQADLFESNYESYFYLPPDIRQQIDTLDASERQVVVEEYLEISISSKRHMKNKGTTRFVSAFEKMNYSNDSTVWKVMDRNRDIWDSILVVVDWTGSMYPYGSQIVKWHHQHFDNSPISFFSVFNDGDMNTKKKIGYTGGVYMIEALNVDAVIETFFLTGSRGNGGDAQENDIEAILEGMNYFNDYRDIVLIADNSCIRDFELITRLDKPVHVIMCGYNPRFGINEQYVELAIATGGSIHTIDEDIWSFDKLQHDGFYTIGVSPLVVVEDFCSFKFLYQSREVAQVQLTDIEQLKKHKNDLVGLSLEGQSLSEVPRKIFKAKRLTGLNLSNNNISRLPKKMNKLTHLKDLNLSHNQLNEIDAICNVVSLAKLDVSHNQIQEMPRNFRYLLRLETLYLQNNQIKELKNFRQSRLVYLDASNNQIEKIDNSLLTSKKLSYLNLSDNNLSALPKNFKRLKGIEILDLSNNQFKIIPAGLSEMKNLKYLNLKGNPIPENELLQYCSEHPWIEIVY